MKIFTTTAVFEAGCKATSVTPIEAVADSDGQGTKEVSETQDLAPMGEGDQSEELRDFMQGMEKENAELHTACAAEKAARAKSLLEVSALQVEKTSHKKKLKSCCGNWQRICLRGKVVSRREGSRRTPWLSKGN